MTHDTPPQPAPGISWRLIVGPAMLLPSLVILAWSLPMLNRPVQDVALTGHSAEERERLQRLLHEPPPERSAPLPADVVRVASSGEPIRNEPDIMPHADDGPNHRWIDPSLLSSINDNHFGIPAAERAAYEQFLAAARTAPLADWERLAHKEVSFGLLMLDSVRWRGELITVEGEVRRLNRIAAPPGTDSAADTFEAWLFTSDSGLNPYRVIVTSQPADLPLSDSIQPPRRVRVTGLFFKRFSYATANGFHSAPLLIAPALSLLPPAGSVAAKMSGRSGLLTVIAVGVLLIFLGVIAIGQVAARRSHHAARSAARELRNSQSPDFDFLNESRSPPGRWP